MRYGNRDHMDGGGWVAVAAVLALIWFVRSQSAAAPRALQAEANVTPQDRIDRRLATGDITEEEYRRFRAALFDRSPPAQPAAPA